MTAISPVCSDAGASAGADGADDKGAFRRDMLARRRAMGAAARAAAAARICGKIAALPEFRRARCIAAFAPAAEEVNIWPLLEDARTGGKIVALPRVIDAKARKMTFHRFCGREHLTPGYGNILEPAADAAAVTAEEFDFALVPALAVGEDKTRLGYGGGFYDIFLPCLIHAPTCAAVFRCQIVAAVPRRPHDRRVDRVISE